MPAATATEQVGIVIVDDAPRTLDNLKKLLAFESDIDVIGTAVTARAGIEQACKLKPDLVLMDVNMPDLDGIRATEILSAELPRTPVVIMSVQEDREYLRRAMQAGAREFLVKPFSADELVAAIRRVNQKEALKRGAPPPRPAAAPESKPAPTAGVGPAAVPRASSGPTPLAPPALAPTAAHPAVVASPAPHKAQPPVPAPQMASAPVPTAPASAVPAPAAPASTPIPTAVAPVIVDSPPAPAEQPLAPDPEPPPPIAAEDGPPQVLKKKRSEAAEVVMVFSGKGGVGKSVVASNLAAAIARETGEEVALVDLDLQFGDAAVLLGLEPRRTVSDIVEHYPDVDGPFVTALMLEAGEHLRVLPAPVSPELADLVTPEHVRAVLDILREAFDHVIVDCSSHLGDITLDALDYADKVVLVSDFGIPAIKETKLALKLFESLGIARERIYLVLNRSESGLEINAEQIEANLRFPVAVEIPSRDRVVLNSIGRGAPFVTVSPDSDISRRIRELAGHLVQLPTGKGSRTPSKRRRFWTRAQEA